ncbi:MAG: CRISPR-associated endonuclease Cas6 [Prevotella sp.]|nr:CRISPR-associated endonuclease Cas6 [Prevotella sp.]
MKYLRTLTIITEAGISQQEIPLFRGAVIKSLGEDANLLFHNHIDDNQFRYSYPLIQYKRLGGKASIVCIEEGADLIGKFLLASGGKLRIGEREIQFATKSIRPTRLLIQTWEQPFNYHITRWLPLNSKNYKVYQSIEGVAEKVTFLENILKANLLSMLKGLDIYLEKEILVKIIGIGNPYLITNKGVKMMAFNADFSCNLTIPNNLGVGKNASIGYGVVHLIKKEEKDNQ